jgi:hypothetical protein
MTNSAPANFAAGDRNLQWRAAGEWTSLPARRRARTGAAAWRSWLGASRYLAVDFEATSAFAAGAEILPAGKSPLRVYHFKLTSPIYRGHA